MACRESRSSGILICLGLLMFVASLCHCKKMTRLKALDEKRENTARTQSKVERSHQHHGRLLIGQNSQQAAKLNGTNSTGDETEVETDYQADMGWWQTKQLNQQGDWPNSDMAAMRRLLEMESKVECTQDSMKLFVQDAAFTPASLIFVDRGLLSPLSLSKLPTSCGYTIRSTQRDLALVAPYDGCFVVVEENSYVLPLRWWGLPVRMSCPLIEYLTPNPPMVTCHTEGMVVKTEWTNSASDIKVNVNGNWEPLWTVAHRCVFGLVEHPEGLVISVRYEPCLGIQDGLYTLELALDGETKISCPSLLPAPLKPAGNMAKGPAQQSEEPSQWMNPFAPNPTLTPPPVQTGFQIPGFSQYPEIPSQPMQTDEQFLYTLFSSLYYPDLTNMEVPPTEQPESPTPTKSASAQATDQSFSYFPFYQPQLPGIPPTWPPVTESPPAKNKDAQISYPFIFPPMFPQQPEQPASDPKGQEPNPPNPNYYTQTQSQAFLYPLYLEKLPEKLDQMDPTMTRKPRGEEYLPFNLFCTQEMSASKSTDASWDQVYQPFYLVCTQLKPALDQTAPQQEYSETSQQFFLVCNQQKSMTSQSYAESSQDQVYQPFYLWCVQWEQTPGAAQSGQYQASQSNLYQAFFPFYTQPLPTAKPEDITQPPQPPTPQPQFYQQFLPFYTQPPPTAKPADVTQPPQGVTPQGQEYQPFFPFYTQPNPTQPPQPATPQPQFYQQFFPFYTQPKPADVEPPQPATPPSNVYQPVAPFYTQPQPTQKPAVQPPQPATPQPQVYQQFFPFYTQPKPADVEPPQPATPPSNVYQPVAPFYTQPQPAQKPAVQPPQPATPQPQFYQQFFPFYTQPKPADVEPPQPATPPSNVYQPVAPFYTQPQPTQKPAVQPPQPATPQPQVYQQFFPFYTQPMPDPKPAVQPPQPATPPSKVYQPSFPFYSQPTPKPAADTWPSQSSSPQGQAYQPFFNFYTPPTLQLSDVTQPPPLLTPQSKVNQQSFPFKPKQPLQPALSEPLQPDVAQAPVSQLFYDMQNPELQQPSKPAEPQQPQASESETYLFPYQLNMEPKPAIRPTAAPQPLQPETLQGQAHQQMCLYTQLLTESQLANMPTKTIQGKVYGPCQQSGKPGAEMPLVPKPGSLDYPVFCPQFCPSDLSSCCLQIAFHQHFHFSGGSDDKDVPQFSMGLSSPQVEHYDPSMVLEAAQIPQKLTEAAILQTLRASAPAHFSPWVLQSAGQKQEYFQPPDGNPAAQGKTEGEVPPSPNFQTDSSHHYWPHIPQEFNGPPKPRAFKPVEQNRLYNLKLPNRQTTKTVAGSTLFMPNVMSYTNQHGSGTVQQAKPDSEQQVLRSIPGFRSSSHHNFKRAIDHFAHPYFMPQDAPESNRNDSSALNNSQAHPFETDSKNSTKHQQALKSPLGSQSYILLQDGPPGKKPRSFSEPLSPFGLLVHEADSRIQSQQPKGTDQDMEPLQGRSKTFIKRKQGPSNPSLGHVDYMQRLGDKSGLPSFFSVSEDADLVYLQPEHYFSAAELKPDVLESFEEIWKSLMPPGSSQLFATHASGKKGDQPANGINQPLKMENGH